MSQNTRVKKFWSMIDCQKISVMYMLIFSKSSAGATDQQTVTIIDLNLFVKQIPLDPTTKVYYKADNPLPLAGLERESKCCKLFRVVANQQRLKRFSKETSGTKCLFLRQSKL